MNERESALKRSKEHFEKAVNNYVSLISKGNRFIRIDDYSIKKTELIFTEHSFKITY